MCIKLLLYRTNIVVGVFCQSVFGIFHVLNIVTGNLAT